MSIYYRLVINGTVEMLVWEGIWYLPSQISYFWCKKPRSREFEMIFFLGHTTKIFFGFHPVRNNHCCITLWQCILALRLFTFDVLIKDIFLEEQCSFSWSATDKYDMKYNSANVPWVCKVWKSPTLMIHNGREETSELRLQECRILSGRTSVRKC